MDVRAEVRITGTVQGVGFRAWTAQTARELGVRGWVRNAPDRSVQAVFLGPRDQVEALVTQCHEGSAAARVDQVRADYGLPRDDEPYVDFRIV